MSEHNNAQWEDALRRGGMQSFAHYRRLVRSGAQWTEDDSAGMLHLLDCMEQYMVEGWQLVDELRTQQLQYRRKWLTRQAVERIRPQKGAVRAQDAPGSTI